MVSRKQDIERAFLTAYEKEADALFRHSFARIRNRELAKDLVQETFTRTWAYLADGKEITHFRAFLYRTLNNAIVDTARKKTSVSLDAMREEDGFEPADEHVEPSAEVRQEMGEALKLLSSLDEMYASVITMRYINEMTPGEIANVLGVSENVVSVRIHRGLKQLREEWGKQIENQ